MGHPLNELADAAGSRAAVDEDLESAALSHADSRAVCFVLENSLRLTEWCAEIRRTQTQVAAKQFRDSLTSRTRQDSPQEAGSASDDQIEGRRQRNLVPSQPNGCYDKNRGVHFWALQWQTSGMGQNEGALRHDANDCRSVPVLGPAA